MRRIHQALLVIIVLSLSATGTFADEFGIGANRFTIDFVPITGDASSANGTATSRHTTFVDPDDDFRIGVYEVTNEQWAKFQTAYGVVTGTPAQAYEETSYFTGAQVPVQYVGWLEAAQFVNWLNTSTGHHAAYNFTGTQGQPDYTFAEWPEDQIGGGPGHFRHMDAVYFLPTEDEWIKAGHWNGSTLQPYTTKPGETLHQGDGVSGTGWNYFENGFATNPPGPWSVGSGSEELNGTYDMMGNVEEILESNHLDHSSDHRDARGGAEVYESKYMELYMSGGSAYLYEEAIQKGFRVASIFPEPSTFLLLVAGITMLRRQARCH